MSTYELDMLLFSLSSLV